MQAFFALLLRGLRGSRVFVIGLLRRIGLMQTPPVDSGEFIYRQVGEGGNPIYYDPNRSPPLYFALFLPGPNDLTACRLFALAFAPQSGRRFAEKRPPFATALHASWRGTSSELPATMALIL